MSQTSTPVHWTDATNLELLELGAAFASQKAGAIPPTSTSVQWIATISAKHGELYTVKQMRSRFQCFKKNYLLFISLKSDSSLGWDDKLQTVTCPKWKWLNYYKVCECVRNFK